MTNSLIVLINIIVRLVAKASADPEIHELAKALHDLIEAHKASTPT